MNADRCRSYLGVAGSAAAGSVTTAVAFDGRIPDATASKALARVDNVLLQRDAIHPITEVCLTKLGGPHDEASPITIMKDTSKIDRLGPSLHGVSDFIDTLLDVVDTMGEVGSSAAINFGVLAKIVRDRVATASARPETAKIFAIFGVPVRNLDPGLPAADAMPTDEVARVVQASMDTVQAEIQARYNQDVAETGVEVVPAAPNSPVPPKAAGVTLLERDQAPMAADPDLDLIREITLIKQALRAFLRRWMAAFPAPEKKVWPQDFNVGEQADVKQFVRDFLRDEANGVDLDLQKQPVDVTEKAVQNILEMSNFPVDGAKDTTVVTSVFRFECNNIYNTRLRNKRRKAEREAAGDDKGKEGEGQREAAETGNQEQPSVDPEDGAPGRAGEREEGEQGRKRNREDGWEPEGDDGDRKRPRKSPGYGAGGTECAACFFSDKDCALLERTDPGRVCNFCYEWGHQCRVLCNDCGVISTTAGRGSGDMGMLLADCQDCDFRGH